MIVLIGLAYVILPFDLIPDVFGPLGMLDDVAVLAFLYTKLKNARADSENRADSEKSSQKPERQDAEEETPWELLGVSRQATPEELRVAYRTKLAEYHPDKVNHLGEDLRHLAHEKTLKIKEAYNYLEKIRTK